MQISETTFTVSRNGSLKIPAEVIRDMGLGPGSHVRVAYLTHDGQHNSFQEFLLSANSLDDLSDERQFCVPSQLLRQSNIPLDADLQIICLDGLLIICQDTALSSDELDAVLDSLRDADKLVCGLPMEVTQAQAQLKDVVNSLQEGENSSDIL